MNGIINAWQAALLSGALFVSLTSLLFRRGRSAAWVAVAAGTFVLSVVYYRMGLPAFWLMNGALDAGACILVYLFGRHVWELALWRLFQAMILVSILYAVPAVGLSHYAYVVALEIINWCVLLLLFATSVPEGVIHDAVRRHRLTGLGIRRAGRALHRKRAEPPFTEKT